MLKGRKVLSQSERDGVISGDIRALCQENNPIKWEHKKVLRAWENRSV